MHAQKRFAAALDRALTLAALLIAAAYDYGWRIPLLCAAAAGASMLSELVCLYIRGVPFRLHHLDAAVCGVLLVMLMPPTVSFTLVIMSAIFANIIGRQIFGGRAHPVLPTAAVGYCFALLNSRAEMALFPVAKTHLPLLIPEDTVLNASVSEVWNQTGQLRSSFEAHILGLSSLPTGSCSVLLLIVVAAVLLLRRSASAWAILPMLCIIVSGNIAVGYFREPLLTASASLLTNQTMIAALYLYGDPDLAPPHIAGICYGLFSGLISLIFTRVLGICDAPVIAVILLSPAALFLRGIFADAESAAAHKEGGGAYAE